MMEEGDHQEGHWMRNSAKLSARPSRRFDYSNRTEAEKTDADGCR